MTVWLGNWMQITLHPW